ncbi:RNA pyrophosphohydrolase [Acidocella aminolytica]|jgi:putative (di)nucleoside polyphosphate hydrolase|uniref:RNA pyrophosphohydrolase n=1 Tax=Acidocella aminolytica 101 = DSM 11237 TaxID=1120923 RepID=A0A0D6PH18_9PROT|nr:RNA pyrophosphohydrolase [Acidocella aminolytica]GAN81075.1 dinucleoside polyphosphate hydrolase [Acidocella aminolytica 101 = DSM 11237]GBQ41514.1 dinucleoside polyphosphate hydrolase [Acidocella aminolytica 101 = DSM 11237]SHF12920.1 putative (di)nucleoside polyphosphate hydrolase [Acidocella aminolytica 101 = DSM 11237]
MVDTPPLPYRLNVGAVLFSPEGLVFVGKRKGFPDAWQLPQGGVDDGENIRLAVLRELKEEIGTDKAEILTEHPEWLLYDLPPHLIGVAWKGKYRGQRQKWFALRFTGEDADIQLDADDHPEFEEWRWVKLADLPDLAVAFKRDIYERLAQDFAPYAQR